MSREELLIHMNENIITRQDATRLLSHIRTMSRRHLGFNDCRAILIWEYWNGEYKAASLGGICCLEGEWNDVMFVRHMSHRRVVFVPSIRLGTNAHASHATTPPYSAATPRLWRNKVAYTVCWLVSADGTFEVPQCWRSLWKVLLACMAQCHAHDINRPNTRLEEGNGLNARLSQSLEGMSVIECNACRHGCYHTVHQNVNRE